MKVVVFHGFGSVGTKSSIAKVVSTIPNCDVVFLSYPTANPYFTAKAIKEQLASSVSKKEELVFVGASLGGFWAQHFSTEYTNAKVVLVNPSLEPWDNLKARIGTNRNSYTNKKFEVTADDVGHYVEFDATVPTTSNLYLLLGTLDDVVDPNIAYDKYNARATVIKVAGDHRLTGFEDTIKRAIIDAYNLVNDAI